MSSDATWLKRGLFLEYYTQFCHPGLCLEYFANLLLCLVGVRNYYALFYETCEKELDALVELCNKFAWFALQEWNESPQGLGLSSWYVCLSHYPIMSADCWAL